DFLLHRLCLRIDVFGCAFECVVGWLIGRHLTSGQVGRRSNAVRDFLQGLKNERSYFRQRPIPIFKPRHPALLVLDLRLELWVLLRSGTILVEVVEYRLVAEDLDLQRLRKGGFRWLSFERTRFGGHELFWCWHFGRTQNAKRQLREEHVGLAE